MKELNYIGVSVRSKGSRDMRTYSARANGRLCTVDTGILQSAKAADRYNDIRKPWRLRTGGDYPTLRWPAKSEAMSPALLPAKRKPVDG